MYHMAMRRFFAFLVFCALLAGCQGNGPGISTGGSGSEPQNLQTAGILIGSPEDQLTRTGMIRTTYSQQDGAGPQYLMHEAEGSVRVADTQEFLNGGVKNCLDQSGMNANKCFEDYFLDRAEHEGPEAAFAELKVLYPLSGQVRSYCHPLAHAIGHGAVEKYPEVNEAYQHGDDFCWSGYYHGVMEAIMTDIGTENLAGELNDICAKIPGKEDYSFDYYNCVHGMGHGLMDVMGDRLVPALNMCDNLTGWWEQQSCFSGVFMQNVINDGLEYHVADLKPDDTVYPCNVVDERYKDQCYLMQTSYMLKINGYDFKKTFDICENVDKGFSVTCYRSLGRDASGSTVSDLKKTHDLCMLGKNYEQRSECAVGAVKDFISYYHDDVKARQLCESFEDTNIKNYCLKTAEEYYRVF